MLPLTPRANREQFSALFQIESRLTSLRDRSNPSTEEMTEAADLVSQRGKCDDPVSLKLVAPMETPFASSSSADSASPSAPLHLTQQAIARLFARPTRTNQSRLLSVPRKCEPIQIDPVRIYLGQPNDATPLRDNQDHPASAGKHRARPGLPPALLLVLTPIRKRLASREFWLGAIVVAWAIAALTIG